MILLNFWTVHFQYRCSTDVLYLYCFVCLFLKKGAEKKIFCLFSSQPRPSLPSKKEGGEEKG